MASTNRESSSGSSREYWGWRWLLTTLADPTRPMEKETVIADFYQADYSKFPKIQIPIEDLFDGKKPHMPWLDPATFRKAAREDMNAGKQEKLF